MPDHRRLPTVLEGLWSAWPALLLLPLLLGCPASSGPERIPLVPDSAAPPLSPELRDAMWSLRDRAQELDAVLRPRGALMKSPEPAAVAAILDDMRSVIRPLLAEPGAFDRQILEHQLPRLDEVLEQARASLDEQPPNFEPSERVTQACLGCHEQRP